MKHKYLLFGRKFPFSPLSFLFTYGNFVYNSEENIRQRIRALSCEDLGAISKRLDSKSLEKKDSETIKEEVSIFDALDGLLGGREVVWHKVFENSFRISEK